MLYSAMNKGLVDLFVKGVSGGGDAGPLQVDALGLGRFAADWSRDGRFIMYIGGGRAIWRATYGWRRCPTCVTPGRC